MSGDSCEQRDSTLVRLEKELGQVRQALSLLGLRACSQCGKFFRASESGALFDGGDKICVNCVVQWWPRRCSQLSVKDREVVERRLVTWLTNHHGAKIVQLSEKPSADATQEFRMVAGCVQCDGAGTVSGRRCQSCGGRGTVWVIVPNEEKQ